MSQEELFERYVSATMTLEDKEELKDLLRNDQEAGRRFGEYLQDTAAYLSLAESMTSQVDETPSQEELFERYVSATMTLEDKEELKDLLRNDQEAGRRFGEYMEDTASYLSLAEEMALEKKAVALDRENKSTTASFRVHKSKRTASFQQPKSKTALRVVLAMAAAFTVAGILFFNYIKSSRHVADVASIEKFSLDRQNLDLTFGDKSFIMSGDKITALEDLAISVKDGSTIYMSKGAACEILENEDGLYVKQLSGRSEYIVAEQSDNKKFRVFTDKARTTVIGTRFTVDADHERSKVRVLEGLVKVDDLSSVSDFVRPGEFAIVNSDNVFSKQVAHQTMLVSKYIKTAAGDAYNVEGIEEKPYLVLLYAEKWDPASRSFIHKLKNFYAENNQSFEVIFMNNNDNFAADYEMPWACIDAEQTEEVENLIGQFKSSFSLNMVLMDQHGNVIAKSVKGKEWIGADTVLDALSDNLDR